ncbi:MAG TPA: aminopeptidase [Solirubrobacteraceae bacterium]|nr:aminopeptidase [Solirubrobacteraceae bacterium]
MGADTTDRIEVLADLIVRFGANVQPGQIVALSSEPGKEPLARAVAEAAYKAGAKFVDLSVFDIYIKRARALHAAPDTLGFVPTWYGERVRALAEQRGALIALTGPVAPSVMDGVDPSLLGKDLLPQLRESIEIVNNRTTNWTAAPCPTEAWANLVSPELSTVDALDRLWHDVAHVCRVDEADPVAAWEERMDRLTAVAGRLDELHLESVHFAGPGTDLLVGVLPSSQWQCARITTVDGVVHAPNLPTEEVFTTPDPARVEGHVRSTKPLFVSGVMITGLRVKFEGGIAVEIDADQGADTLRALSNRDPGAARLGEVALVDGESRIGNLDTVFFDTLLDENAASHIALGEGLDFTVLDDDDRQQINRSELHIDFMIGSSDVAVTGIAPGGAEVPLLRNGVWQI